MFFALERGLEPIYDPTMPRYVLALKRTMWGADTDAHFWTKVLRALKNTSLSAANQITGSRQSRRVIVEAELGFDSAVPKELRDTIHIEPEILHFPQVSVPPLQFDFTVLDAAGKPLERSTVRLQEDLKQKARILIGRTDINGHVRLTAGTGGRVEISPIPNHWSAMIAAKSSGPLTFRVQGIALPAAKDGIGWWHEAVGIGSADHKRGTGIRAGVIDSGCGPHQALGHIRSLGTFLGAQPPIAGSDDGADHGTHICGIIGAKPAAPVEFAGLVPGTEVFVAKVCEAGAPANQADIANALDAMVDADVDLVNVSLAARQPSQTLVDSIENAWLHGTLCFSAAGNLAQSVMWPARHEKVLAVTAVAKPGAAPLGTLSQSRLSDCTEHDADHDLTFANFSCRGTQVACCAPGVGIISCLPASSLFPQGAWGDMDGTSMACPVALSVLCAILGDDAAFTKMERDENRAAHARECFDLHCVPLSFDQDFQGNGLPVLDLQYLNAYAG